MCNPNRNNEDTNSTDQCSSPESVSSEDNVENGDDVEVAVYLIDRIFSEETSYRHTELNNLEVVGMMRYICELVYENMEDFRHRVDELTDGVAQVMHRNENEHYSASRPFPHQIIPGDFVFNRRRDMVGVFIRNHDGNFQVRGVQSSGTPLEETFAPDELVFIYNMLNRND